MNDLEQFDATADVAAVKELLDEIRTDITSSVASERLNAENTRYCYWDGQDTDGRKHRETLGKDPLPFEGASDVRHRLADTIINEQVAELVLSAMRAQRRLTGIESTDDEVAARLTTLLNWIVKNQWGDDYRRQIELLAQYSLGDSPAAAVCMVDWVQERALESKMITAEDVMQMYVEFLGKVRGQGAEGEGELPSEVTSMEGQGGEEATLTPALSRERERESDGRGSVTPEDVAELQNIVENPLRDAELRMLLTGIFPTLKPKKIGKLARELRENGSAKAPVPYVRINLPMICALRYAEDVFFPGNTTDIQRARCIVRAEWLTRAEGLERAATEQWKPEFTTAFLGDGKNSRGQEGAGAFEDLANTTDRTMVPEQTDKRKGLYQLLTVFKRSVDEDGVLGIYIYKMCYYVPDTFATVPQMFDRKHGKYPFVYIPRECLTLRLIDSRGIPEIVQTEQETGKLFRDSVNDHVQKVVNPPILKPNRGPKYQLALAPFSEMEVNARERIEYLRGPDYPKVAMDMMAEVQRQVDEYFGREGQTVTPAKVQIMAQMRVDRFLSGIAEILTMTLQLAQQYMTDEEIQRVTGGGGVPIARTTKEIQGKFDLQLSMDVRDFNWDFLVKKAEIMLKNVRPLDVRGELPWNYFARQIVTSVDPNWGAAIPPAQESMTKIVDEETLNFTKLLNGVDVAMPEEIDAPELRLETLNKLWMPRQQNPAAFAPVGAAAQEMLATRVEYLTFQAQQMQNAQVGRVGAEKVDVGEIETPAGGRGSGM